MTVKNRRNNHLREKRSHELLLSRAQETIEFLMENNGFVLVCERPREGRALGAVVLRAARNGLMVKSGHYRPSAGSHGTVKPIWRSEVYTA